MIDGSLDDPSAGVSIVTLSCSQSFQITIQDLAITNTQPAHPDQAGLDNSGCKLELKNSTVSGHSGVAILHRGDTLSIEDSVVAHNGLGISVSSGTGTLMRSTVFSNATRGVGGGVYIGESCTLRVHRSTIANKFTIGGGGGIQNSGELVVTQSVITNNGSVLSVGGGILNSGVATLTRSVIVDNEASRGDGGGILNSGKLTLIDSTILSNRAFPFAATPIIAALRGVAAGFSMLAVLPARA